MKEEELERNRQKFLGSLFHGFSVRSLGDEKSVDASGSFYWFDPAGGTRGKDDEEQKLFNEILAEFGGDFVGRKVNIVLLLQSKDGHNYAYFKYAK